MDTRSHDTAGQTIGPDSDGESATALNLLSEELARNAPERAVALAKRALNIAAACKDLRGRAESYRNIGVARLYLARYGSALLHLRRAVRLFNRSGDLVGKARSLSNIGSVYIRQGEYVPALGVFQEALEIGQQLNEPRITNLVLSNLGVLYGYFGDYPKSLDCHYRSLRIKRELDMPLAAEMNSIAGVHFNMGDYERALQLFLECLDAYRNVGDRYGEAIALGNIGESEQALGRWEPALGYWQDALAVYRQLHDTSGIAHTMQSLARYYRAAGDVARALEIYAEAHELVLGLQSKSWIVQIQTNIGELYAECGRCDEALELLQEALTISREQGAREDEMECHRLISEIHEQREAGMDALGHFKQYAMIREELFGQEKRNALAELQTRAEIETIEREREILRLKADRLEMEMEHKAKELTSLAMQLVQKNELLDAICSQIREAEQERSQSLGLLLRQIESNKSSAREWEQFEQQFQSLHHDFIDRLAREHPSLSPTELKVCALLKINLSTKEIANILCSSVRTVEDHRYRIRTKLGLKSAANLAALIAGM